MNIQKLRHFTPHDHKTWKMLFTRQTPLRSQQLHPIFSEGLEKLGISGNGIPDLELVNKRLMKLTGFQGVPVEGLEAGQSFFEGLRGRMFPLGNFIRDKQDLNYTPAPDIFHDLYGHIPFYANKTYADFCQAAGEEASKTKSDPVRSRQWERFFWFTIEFGLVETSKGRRIFGAGIASSFSECAYALSKKPKVFEYTVDRVRAQEYRIDNIQGKLFLLNSPEKLYDSLPDVVNAINTYPEIEVIPLQESA